MRRRFLTAPRRAGRPCAARPGRRALDGGRIASSYDRRIIATPDAAHTPATVFPTGMWIERHPDVTKRLTGGPLPEFGDHSCERGTRTGRATARPRSGAESAPRTRAGPAHS